MRVRSFARRRKSDGFLSARIDDGGYGAPAYRARVIDSLIDFESWARMREFFDLSFEEARYGSGPSTPPADAGGF